MARKKSVRRKAKENLVKMADRDIEAGREKKQARKMGAKTRGREKYEDAVAAARARRTAPKSASTPPKKKKGK